MAVLGVAIVYWILMSNFLRNTLDFGQGILILTTKGTVNDVTEKYPLGNIHVLRKHKGGREGVSQMLTFALNSFKA